MVVAEVEGVGLGVVERRGVSLELALVSVLPGDVGALVEVVVVTPAKSVEATPTLEPPPLPLILTPSPEITDPRGGSGGRGKGSGGSGGSGSATTGRGRGRGSCKGGVIFLTKSKVLVVPSLQWQGWEGREERVLEGSYSGKRRGGGEWMCIEGVFKGCV